MSYIDCNAAVVSLVVVDEDPDFLPLTKSTLRVDFPPSISLLDFSPDSLSDDLNKFPITGIFDKCLLKTLHIPLAIPTPIAPNN